MGGLATQFTPTEHDIAGWELRADASDIDAAKEMERPITTWALLAILILCLLAFLIAKAEFHSSDPEPLFYLYGLTVTGIILMQMTVAFFFYRDPYEESLEHHFR